MQPKVGVVILNWNKPELTVDCVRSVLEGSYKHFKIFLIDNGSADNSVKLFNKKFAGDSRVIVLRTSKNLGYARGNNFGSKIAIDIYHPEFLCILNNDVVTDPQFLQELVGTSFKFGRQNIYCPLILTWESNKILSGGSTDYLPTPFQFKYKRIENNGKLKSEQYPFLGGCCFLIKTSLYKSLNGFREDFFMYSEDTELGIRANRLGSIIFVVPNSLIWHKGASSFSPLSAFYSTRNNLYLVKNYLPHKTYEYLRTYFWLSILIIGHLLRRKPKVATSFLRGILSFVRGETGQNINSYAQLPKNEN